MSSNIKEYLLQALRMMLKPLVKLFISQGVTHAEFSEAAKEVYVEIALRDFETTARINKSRVAILTGLTRKEVKNVIDRVTEDGKREKLYSRPERVLAGWYGDPRYTGPYGIPLELPYESSEIDEPSIVDLVKTYSGDMAPRQMLKELLRSGAVVEVDGRYKSVSRKYEPAALSPELIVRLGEIGHRFFSTAAMNIEKKGQGTGYFDRLVYADEGCTNDVIGLFDEYIRVRGQEFLEELDVWFSANEKLNRSSEARKGTGLYMVHYVETEEEKTSLRELLQTRDTASLDED
jgi:DNA-binding Lrp family transcriptional regulator